MDAATALDSAGTTVDAFLGGRIEAVQAGAGHHRAGLEAVLLGAALEAGLAGTIVDLGAGSGVAGMVAALRCPEARIVLLDRDETAVACAREALARPANRAFADRIRVVPGDIGIAGRSGELPSGSADAVIANPPFHAASLGTRSPGEARAAAHALGTEGLDPWLRAAAAVLKPQGELVLVFRASGLGLLLGAMANRFGAVDLLPIHPRAGEPAHRILLRAVKGSRAPLAILPPLVLHPPSGNAFLPPVERLLRDGAALAEIHPPWAGER